MNNTKLQDEMITVLENVIDFIEEEWIKIKRKLPNSDFEHFTVSDDFHPHKMSKMRASNIPPEKKIHPCGKCQQYKRAIRKRLVEYWVGYEGEYGIEKVHFLCAEHYEQEENKIKYVHPNKR